MATAEQQFRMLQELAQHTRLGNVKWRELEAPYAYIWPVGDSAVVVRSVKGTGDYPVELAVWKVGEETPIQSWVTHETSPPGEEMWDEHVRDIWTQLVGGADPITEILQELDMLPPF